MDIATLINECRWSDLVTAIVTSKVGMGVIIVVGVLLVAALFSPQLRALFPRLFERLDEIRYGDFVVKFGSGLREAQHQLSRNPELTKTGRAPLSRPSEPVPSDLSSRDLVLESWGSLKQVIYDSVASHNIQLTPATQPPEAVDRLARANVILADQANHIKLLYELGKQIVGSASIPRKGDATAYHELVYGMLDWLMLNALPPRKDDRPPRPEPRSEQRKTEVGGSFPRPSAGPAAVTLVGMRGAVAGRQYPVQKDVFRIGSRADNDLVIANDDYVSGFHAALRYESGSLWLVDQHSRNGTFLNDVRLRDAPVIVKPGDRIRIGQEAFELMSAGGG